MNIEEKIDKYLNESKDLKAKGFKKKDNGWYFHPDYPGYEVNLDDRNKIKVRNLKTGRVEDTVNNPNEFFHVYKNFKK